MIDDCKRDNDSAPGEGRPGRRSRTMLRLFGFGLCVVLGVLLGDSLLPRFSGDRDTWRSVSEDGPRNRLRRFWATTEGASEVGKNHEMVRAAFREIVRSAAAATVKVQVDGRQVALGTVVDRQGHILTKASELDGSVRCKVPGGEALKAKIVATDRKLDLALLRIKRTDLVPVTFATKVPKIGSWLAVPDTRSGAPLLVGVISSQSRAIDRDDGFLGVVLEHTSRGSRIDHILPESSAMKHGLQTGDVIFAVDGRRIQHRSELIQTVQQYRPGDHVEFGIIRDGQEIKRRIRLTRREEVAAAEDGSLEHEGGPLSLRRSGFPKVLQHDCPIRPNQCGGPLVNLDGDVVGINIARAGRVESYAIPAYLIQLALRSLKAESN